MFAKKLLGSKSAHKPDALLAHSSPQELFVKFNTLNLKGLMPLHTCIKDRSNSF